MRAIMATTSARCAPAAAGEGLGQACRGMVDPCSAVGGGGCRTRCGLLCTSTRFLHPPTLQRRPLRAPVCHLQC
jgi:hypothetical protein